MIPENCVVLIPSITGWYVDKFFKKFGHQGKVLIEYSDNYNLTSIIAHSMSSKNLVLITDYLTPKRLMVEAAYLCGKVGVNFFIASPNSSHFVIRSYATGEFLCVG